MPSSVRVPRRASLCVLRTIAACAIVAGAGPLQAGPPDVQPWILPATGAHASQPGLTVAGSGLLLGWVEKREGGQHALRASRYADGGTWDATRTIAAGTGWFVNWADTPHLIALADGSLWAHWLRRNGSGTYDYGIALVRSNDDGKTWSDPIRIEPEGLMSDYGFVTFWRQSRDTLGIAWLDSRQKPAAAASGAPVGDHSSAHASHGGGAMMLRAAVFDPQGGRIQEWPLDTSTCDCCPTASASTARGTVVVYRGRSADEIRDTRIVSFDGARWSPPRTVHADGWRFAGCPVNGPAVAAHGDDVWVAWYTEADGQPSVRIAYSADAGESFSEPLRVASGRDLLGRVALAAESGSAWLTWLGERGGSVSGQEIWLARFDTKAGVPAYSVRIAELAARGRASGLPRIAARDSVAWLVWTDIIDGKPQLRGVSAR